MEQLTKAARSRGVRMACVLAVFALYFLVAAYKLTHAALWMDEAVEFAVSTASLHSGTMLQMIQATYQPPLYNLLLHFWLTVSTGEWWFRFAGVLFGFAGAAGLFCTVRRACGRLAPALTSVVIFTFSIKIVYYLQECAEYSLLLGILPWLLYFYVCLWQAPSLPATLGWGVCCVLALYTQYGAVFPVAATAVCLFVRFLQQKQTAALRQWLCVCAVCGVLFGLPLALVFFLPQSTNQASLPRSEAAMGNLLQFFTEFPRHLYRSFSWLFLHDSEGITGVILAVFLLVLLALSVLLVLRRRGGAVFGVWAAAALCFVLFYIAAFGGWYGHPFWGNVNPFKERYILCLAPLLLAASLLVFADFLQMLCAQKPGFGKACTGVCLALVCLFCLRNWNYELRDNWVKNDNRDLVAQWYSLYAYDCDTLVNNSTVYAFRYYLRHDPAYRGEYEDRIVYQDDLLCRDTPETTEEYTAYVLESWPDGLPETLFLPVSHKQSSFDNLQEALRGLGYELTSLYNRDGAALWKAHREP